MIGPAVILRAQFDEDNNRVRLDVALDASVACLTIQVARDSEDRWHSVRNLTLLPTDGSEVTVHDYEAPLNRESRYRALPYEARDSVLFCASEYSNVVGVTPTTNWAI